METEFKIVKIGNLKYDRLKAISVLCNILRSFGYMYPLGQTKILLDTILANELIETFNHKFKYAFDTIFDHVEYEEINHYEEEHNFPINFIPPFC
jgi:hypothetical protein